MADLSRGPGIPFPPPFVFAAGWLIAWLLNRWIPFQLDVDGPSLPQQAVGLTFIVGGLMVMAWAIQTFARAHTAVVPTAPATMLVRTGPFRFTRNPMYVGITAAYVGLAILVNVAWPFVVLPAVLIALLLVVIRREERHLQHMFPGEYPQYCSRVRRWL
ncbi:MAG: isoprenylcysteine carboxylmethyltransferase family protein [Vicinamibacterales bacterium]